MEQTEEFIIDSNWSESIESFDDMDLNHALLRGIYSYGFEKPSAIQQKGIRPIILNRDTIAQAQSGTGKTATTDKDAVKCLHQTLPRTEVIIA